MFFVNLLFFEGKVNNYKFWCSYIWCYLDDVCIGMLLFVFEDGMGFECYVDYVFDVLMYFVYCDGKYINVLG